MRPGVRQGNLFRESLALDPDVARAVPDQAARALAELVPEIAELRVLQEVAIDPESQRALVLEGGVRLLSAGLGADGVVVIDDVQWSDASSLELVEQLVRRHGGVHLLLAHRPEEQAAAEFLARLADLTTVREIKLGPLSVEAICELVEDAQLAQTISAETDATPLAVAEVLRLPGRGGDHRTRRSRPLAPHWVWSWRAGQGGSQSRTTRGHPQACPPPHTPSPKSAPFAGAPGSGSSRPVS